MSAARVATRAVSRTLPVLARRQLVPPVFAAHRLASPAGHPPSRLSSSWASDWTNGAEGPELAPLPELPEVKPYPTPLLTQDDISQYLRPLYQRGWHVTYKRKDEIPALARSLRFKAYLHLVNFFNDLSLHVRTEGHHPTITCDNKNLLVETTTHSARKGYTDITMGPTLRDVRLALLVERLRDAYAADNRVFPEPAHEASVKRPRTVEALLGEHAKQSNGGTMPTTQRRRRLAHRCTICMSYEHHARHCPERHTATPRTACVYCDGKHFAINCPKLGDPSVTPTTPCKTCGEFHWASQCPHRKPARLVAQ